MRDVIIEARTDGYEIDKSNKILGISSENLQGKIIFKPEPFISGVCRMYIADKGSILLDKEDDCYTLPIRSSLLKEDFNFCFKITQPETDKGIPIFATKILELQVLETIEDDTEIPEQYPTWIETFDSKIAQMQALEETVTKNEDERKKAETERTTAENNRIEAEKDREGKQKEFLENLKAGKYNGSSGIVVQPDEPTKEDIIMWFDTDDEEDNYLDLEEVVEITNNLKEVAPLTNLEIEEIVNKIL